MLTPNRIKIGVLAFIVFVAHTEVFSMASLGAKLCVFSGVEGQVVNNGKPVVNAVIKRMYEWKDGYVTDQISTDSDGRFAFTPKYEKSLFAIFPHNPSIGQRIKILVDGEEYQAWGFRKDNYDENGELDGKKMNLHCDLAKPKQTYEINSFSNYVGICTLL